jgi:hypothetical protein
MSRALTWQTNAPQIRKEFNDKEAANAASATENSLSKSCKKWMNAACTKYDDVQSINKVAEVQAKVGHGASHPSHSSCDSIEHLASRPAPRPAPRPALTPPRFTDGHGFAAVALGGTARRSRWTTSR